MHTLQVNIETRCQWYKEKILIENSVNEELCHNLGCCQDTGIPGITMERKTNVAFTVADTTLSWGLREAH